MFRCHEFLSFPEWTLNGPQSGKREARLFIFAGQGGELVFGSPSRLVDVLFVVLGGTGLIALGVAVWGLRGLVSGSRRGRVGWWLGIAGTGVLGLFAVQAGVSMVRTGEVPENFVLFLVGFLLLVVGQVLFARDLRHHLGWAWILPLVATVGLIAALTATDALGPTHDIGLFIFEAAWVALGVALLSPERLYAGRNERPRRASLD